MRLVSSRVFAWSWAGRRVAVPYDVSGAGDETVLLLPAPGAVSSREEMVPLAALLAPTVRTIVPDWPGFGAGRHDDLAYGPPMLTAFLSDFTTQIVRGPACVVAAGHAAGYALALARTRPGLWSRIVLVAPTWRGPLPTVMGGYGRWQAPIRAALRAPVVGPALYRLNMSGPVIRAMLRRHVGADAAPVTPALVERKAAIARRPGGRFATAAFVTGALDPVRDRASFLALCLPASAPTMVVVGADTPARSLAEMEALALLPGVVMCRLSAGALGLCEERPAAVFAACGAFLGAA